MRVFPEAFIDSVLTRFVTGSQNRIAEHKSEIDRIERSVSRALAGDFQPMPGFYYGDKGKLIAKAGCHIGEIKRDLFLLACFTGQRQEVDCNGTTIWAEPATPEPIK